MHGPWHMPEHPDERDNSEQEREAEEFNFLALAEAHLPGGYGHHSTDPERDRALRADAAKLLAMGEDPGPTLEDFFGAEGAASHLREGSEASERVAGSDSPGTSSNPLPVPLERKT